MKTVDCSTLGTLLGNGEPIDLIDIRSKNEFSTMHIPGARSFPFPQLARPRSFQKRQRTEQPIYIIGDDRVQASLATGILGSCGFANAIVVDGGMKAWLALGFPVLRNDSSAAVSSLLKVLAGVLTIIAGVAFAKANPLAGGVVLLSAVTLFLMTAFVVHTAAPESATSIS